LWNDKHELFHALFGNRTVVEAIRLLERVQRRLKNRRPRPELNVA